jgi:hypothetical protein
VSLELNLAFGNCLTIFVPLIAKAPEPIPTLWFIIVGILSMVLITTMKEKPVHVPLEQSVLSALVDEKSSIQFINMDPLREKLAKWNAAAPSESSRHKDYGSEY